MVCHQIRGVFFERTTTITINVLRTVAVVLEDVYKTEKQLRGEGNNRKNYTVEDRTNAFYDEEKYSQARRS